MSSKTKRYFLFFLLGIALNLGLYNVAHFFHLPAWIDNVGSALIAFLIEPSLGLLVAFATNFYQAAFIYDSSTLIYYAASAATALIFGIGMRKEGRIHWKRLPLCVLVFVGINTFLEGSITMWRTGGISDSGWEQQFYYAALDAGIANWIACYGSALLLKIVDGLILGVSMGVGYLLIPKKWINAYHAPFTEEEDNETIQEI